MAAPFAGLRIAAVQSPHVDVLSRVGVCPVRAGGNAARPDVVDGLRTPEVQAAVTNHIDARGIVITVFAALIDLRTQCAFHAPAPVHVGSFVKIDALRLIEGTGAVIGLAAQHLLAIQHDAAVNSRVSENPLLPAQHIHRPDDRRRFARRRGSWQCQDGHRQGYGFYVGLHLVSSATPFFLMLEQ